MPLHITQQVQVSKAQSDRAAPGMRAVVMMMSTSLACARNRSICRQGPGCEHHALCGQRPTLDDSMVRRTSASRKALDISLA